ncbi:MAG: S41 family peptidase [Planctomycetota bacterium]
MHTRLLVLIPLLSLISVLAPGALAAQDNVDAKIQRIIDRHTGQGLDKAWEGCRSLEELGDDVIDWAENTLVEGDVLPQLMAAKTLISIGAVEKPERIERALRRIAENDDNPLEIRGAAIEMLGEFGSNATVRLLERLLDGDAALDADLRIRAAKALFYCASDYQRSRQALLPLMEVDNPTTRARAAIALGEIGYLDGPARRILTSLAKEPTALGAQARLVLQQDLLMRRLERMRERRGDAAPGTGDGRKLARLERELEKRDAKIAEIQSERDKYKKAVGTEFAHPLLSSLLERITRLYVDPSLIDQEELIIAAAKGMVASLDRFSSFMDVEDVSEFEEGISGEYAGIGAQVAKDPETDYLKILRPIYRGPAYEAGIVTDDQIIEVGGIETKGVSLADIVKNLKGKPGSPVSMKVFRRGWNDPREFEIERRLIRLDSVRYSMLPGKLGYISLSQFGDTAVTEVVGALDDLEAEGMKGLILDLRNNPGGYLDAATRIVDLFVDKKDEPIVSQRDKSNNLQEITIYSTPGKRGDYPITVLINESSASASEIVSGALQDFDRATLVGKKTYGKGSVQRLLTLPPSVNELLGGETRLRLTVQYYYLPSGRSIHTQRDREGRITEEGGVTPDLEQDRAEVPLWRIASMESLLENSAFQKYVEKYFPENEEAFLKIATHGDGGNPAAYPKFEEFFSKFNKEHADEDDIRRTLRRKLRRIAQDKRGQEFACDYPEDLQLQRAIAVTLEKLGADGNSIDEYKSLFARLPEPGSRRCEFPADVEVAQHLQL